MGQSYFLDQGTQTTNLASISKRKVAALPIVLPPFDEAVEIAKRIREAFASADRVADETSAAVALLDRLDAALVARALRGELEPQDIDEEPAQTLLERIRLESARAAVQPKSKERKSIRREAVMASSTTLESALASAVDWLTADEAFRLCGAVDGAETETVERLYEELRQLDKAGRLQVQKVADSEGRKLHDLIRLKAA
jgi:type I restriction enzyme S subunit